LPGTPTNGSGGDVTNGLLLWLKFNDGSGATASDSSGNGNSATLYNSPSWVSGFGGFGAISFTTSGSQYASVADNGGTIADQGVGSNMTLCCWIQRPSGAIGNWVSVIAKANAQLQNFFFGFCSAPGQGGHPQSPSDNDLVFDYHNSSGGGTGYDCFASSSAFTDTGWHHFAITYTIGTGTSAVLYYDGAAITGSWTEGNGNDSPISSSGDGISIGAITFLSYNGYGSVWQDLRWYSRILSATEISSIYNGGTPRD
jgi:hypothetical protein